MKVKTTLNLSDYEIFVFDCDGVLIDSNKLKTKAFKLTLENYPKDIVDNFISYHEQNGGISRYVKFKHFLSKILEIKNYQYEHQALLKKFSLISTDLISKEAEFIPGINSLLNILNKNKKTLVVCSGTDENDLKKILAFKKINHYFSHIYGSPKTKEEILSNVLNLNNHHKMKAIFFGDAFSDYEAAANYGFDFIFVSYNSDWKDISQTPYYKNLESIHSFKDLEVTNI